MHRTNEITCPWCGRVNDAVTDATGTTGEDAKPDAGSITICIDCLGVGEFFNMKDGRLNIKPVNQQELDSVTRATIHAARQRLISIKRSN